MEMVGYASDGNHVMMSPVVKATIEERIGPITEHAMGAKSITFTNERGRITVTITQIRRTYYVDLV